MGSDDIESDDEVERYLALGEQCDRELGLRHSAWEAIEQAAVLAVLFRQTIDDDADDDVIWYELPGVHVAGGFLAERRAGLEGIAEHFARREVGNV